MRIMAHGASVQGAIGADERTREANDVGAVSCKPQLRGTTTRLGNTPRTGCASLVRPCVVRGLERRAHQRCCCMPQNDVGCASFAPLPFTGTNASGFILTNASWSSGVRATIAQPGLAMAQSGEDPPVHAEVGVIHVRPFFGVRKAEPACGERR